MASGTQHPNHNLISSEDVEGTDVYDAAGNNIGEVDHLMIDKVSGRVGYAVISFGGFMGLGHSHYPDVRQRCRPAPSPRRYKPPCPDCICGMYEDSGAAEAFDSVEDKCKGPKAFADAITKRVAIRRQSPKLTRQWSWRRG